MAAGDCAARANMAAGGAVVRAPSRTSVPLRASARTFRSRELVRRCLFPPAQSCEPPSRRQVDRVFKCFASPASGTPQPTLREHHGREQGRVNREDSAKTCRQSEREGKPHVSVSFSRDSLFEQVALLEHSRTTPSLVLAKLTRETRERPELTITSVTCVSIGRRDTPPTSRLTFRVTAA